MNISSTASEFNRPALDGQTRSITELLAPVRRSIGLGRLARGTLLGFAVGAVLGALVLAVEAVAGLPVSRALGEALPLAGMVAGVAAGTLRWPLPLEAARAADLHFGLEDRLTTALELSRSNVPVANLQRRDMATHIQDLPLARGHGRQLQWRHVLLAVLSALALAVALILTTHVQPRHAAGSTASSTRRLQHRSAARVQRIASRLNSGLTPAQRQSAAMRQLNLALAHLRRQLLQTSSPRAALRSVSLTQQQLRQLAAGLHPINSKAVAQLNSSLGRYMNQNRAGSRTSPSSRSAQAMAQALNRLAQSLAHLTPAQRAALARALAQAANTTSNNALRAQLRQSASALANNDSQQASSALQRMAQSLAQSQAAQSALSRLGAAGSQLDALKNQISGASGTNVPNTAAGNAPGAPQSAVKAAAGGQGLAGGTGRGQGQGVRPGQGNGKGQGTRSGRGTQPGQGRGRGRGTGRGTQTGRGTGRGPGQGRGTAGARVNVAATGHGVSGAHGAGGRGRAAQSRSGRNVTVFIPAKQGKGTEIVRVGPNGAPAPGFVVPYQQVLGQYSQTAHHALDRASLPPAVQGDVLRYFSTISH